MALAELRNATIDAGMSVRPADEDLDMFGITHQGRVRDDNQDQFLVCTVHPQVVIHGTSLADTKTLPLRGTRLATILVVADGVGGAEGGSDAARIATESVTRYVSSTLRCYHAAGSAAEGEFLGALRAAAIQAHYAVFAEAALRADKQRMATTLTVGIAVWPWFYAVQVGDSRCYFCEDGMLRQITRDQTIAQDLVDRGALPLEQLEHSPLKNVLSSAIGADEALPDVTRVGIAKRGCVLLLCSDGLTKHVDDDEIASHIATMTSSQQVSRDLLELALERGGSDNITIVVARALPKKRSEASM